MGNVNTITECDRLQENTIVVNGINEEPAVNKATDYKRIELEKEYEGMKVYLEFPETTKDEDSIIISEVKSILANALLEQIGKIS